MNATPFNEGTPGDGVPNSVLVRDSRIQLYTTGGILLPLVPSPITPDGRLRGFGANQATHLQFDSSGSIVPYNPGYSFGGFTSSGGDGYFPQEFGQVTSDLERDAVNLNARYELTERLEAFFESTYYTAEAVEVIDSGDTNCCFATSGVSGQITFSNTYPLLSDQARATLAANGITQFRLARSLADLTNAGTFSDSRMRRGVLGLKGEFALGSREFNWEASANLGRYESTFHRTQLDQQRFVNALNVVRDANGSIVSSPTPVATLFYGTGTTPFPPVTDPNCVPLNLFGEGAASLQAIDYVTARTSATSTQEQAVYNANITGSPFNLWSGSVAMNIGYEHRKERAEFLPDEFQELALSRSVPIQTTRGEFSTDELFAEMLVPLVSPTRDLPLLKRLDVTAKGRYVDSEVNGGYTAYTVGLQWRPFDMLELRGNKTRSLRAPAITELFTPASE
ncbi:MAG: TonB-dependent receptor, partial [Steroidobacteraceae bacterium]